LPAETGPYHPSPTTTSHSPPVIPGYEILGELGHGGMGMVYQARQLSLNRLVALKMIRSGDLASPQDLSRFRSEAEAVAHLKHPNIVHIYEVGESEGRPYFSMEYVEGGSLAQKIKGIPQPPGQAAELLEVLARAVHAAHQRGIIHRDLKPANILLSSDECQVMSDESKRPNPLPNSLLITQHSSLIPKITDFGLAKRLDLETNQTQTGAVMGSPSYMAPEQAAGKTKEIGPAADVYSLGAILYELLTGRPPFLADTWEATRELVLTTEPVPPRRLQPKMPRDLQTICMKCLEKEPQRRYGSAGALAEDLKRWQNGDPIQARPETRIRRAWRFFRRRPLTTMLSTAIAFALVITPVITYFTNPERRIEAIERQLNQGHKVTLIGETGQPRWYQWLTTEGTKKAFHSEDGTFAIQSFEYGLLELLRDPQQDSFLFSAEVRHDQGPRADSEAGIFFTYTNEGTAKRRVHCYCVLGFSDETDSFNFEPQVKEGPPKGIPFNLKIQRHREPDMFCENLSLQLIDVPFAQLNSGQSRSWHRVALHFNRSKIRCFWDGACKGEFLQSQLIADSKSILGDTAGEEELIAKFALRNGVGLYIYRSTASFRNVSIEPL
jgi:serine/threonine protein kinase